MIAADSNLSIFWFGESYTSQGSATLLSPLVIQWLFDTVNPV